MLRDEVQKKSILWKACREVSDFTLPFFETLDDVAEMPSHELNHLYDAYLEMVSEQSPSLMGLSDEDFLALSQVWNLIDWNELTGPQWYAAQRFLNSIRPLLHRGSLSGLRSTVKSTSESDETDSALSAGAEATTP